MPRLEAVNRFYAEDKDLLDLLLSAKQKLTDEKLRELALARGIICGKSDTREALATYLARLPHAWPDVARLLEAVETAERSARYTSESVHVKASYSELEDAIDQVRTSRSSGNEVLSYRRVGQAMQVTVEYNEVDSTKTRLKQHSRRSVEILLAPSETTVELRRHDNERAAEVSEQVIAALEAMKAEALERRRVDLSGIRDPSMRTRFFTTLIRSIEGFSRVTDVSVIDVSRFPLSKDQSSDSEFEEDEDAADSETEDARGMVRRALLKGGALFQTEEFQRLKDAGFFPSEIRWTVVRDVGDPIEVTFEAGFGNAVEGSGFAYKVSGVQRWTRKEKLAKGRSKPKRKESEDWTTLLERAALRALDAVDTAGAETPANDAEAS